MHLISKSASRKATGFYRRRFVPKRNVEATTVIEVLDDDNLYDELSKLSTEELQHKLKFEEQDAQTIAIIKKILKER